MQESGHFFTINLILSTSCFLWQIVGGQKRSSEILERLINRMKLVFHSETASLLKG
jgi:hypothetical protein